MWKFQPPEAFSSDTPALWHAWRKLFRQFFTATKLSVDCADMQVRYLLYAMGPQMVTIYDSSLFRRIRTYPGCCSGGLQ